MRFGDAQAHTGGPLFSMKYEAAILSSIMDFLCYRTDVARFWRQNSGAMKVEATEGRDGRYVAFIGRMFRQMLTGSRCNEELKGSDKGMPDIMGWMSDGRILAIECKDPSKKATQGQANFLGDVKRSGGVAILAYSIEDVRRVLDADAGRHLG